MRMLQLLLFFGLQPTTCFVTKAKPISYINSKCHIKTLKSSRTCLIGYLAFISHKWFLIAWGQTHPRTHTYQPPGQKQLDICLVKNRYIIHVRLIFISWSQLPHFLINIYSLDLYSIVALVEHKQCIFLRLHFSPY